MTTRPPFTSSASFTDRSFGVVVSLRSMAPGLLVGFPEAGGLPDSKHAKTLPPVMPDDAGSGRSARLHAREPGQPRPAVAGYPPPNVLLKNSPMLTALYLVPSTTV